LRREISSKKTYSIVGKSLQLIKNRGKHTKVKNDRFLMGCWQHSKWVGEEIQQRHLKKPNLNVELFGTFNIGGYGVGGDHAYKRPWSLLI
jgi:hypothetical protein